MIPTLNENLAGGGSIEYATLILATWCFYCDKGVNEKNEPLEIVDEMKAELHRGAKNAQDDKIGFLNQSEIFGDLAKNKRFVKKYAEVVQLVYKERNIRLLMSKLI